MRSRRQWTWEHAATRREQPRQLHDVQRVPARRLAEHVSEDGIGLRVGEELREHSDLVGLECAERHPLDGRGAAEIDEEPLAALALAFGVAVRADDEGGDLRPFRCEVLEQRERRAVRPLDVVDDEDDRTATRQCFERGTDRDRESPRPLVELLVRACRRA